MTAITMPTTAQEKICHLVLDEALFMPFGRSFTTLGAFQRRLSNARAWLSALF
jgi:hypothetical protein